MVCSFWGVCDAGRQADRLQLHTYMPGRQRELHSPLVSIERQSTQLLKMPVLHQQLLELGGEMRILLRSFCISSLTSHRAVYCLDMYSIESCLKLCSMLTLRADRLASLLGDRIAPDQTSIILNTFQSRRWRPRPTAVLLWTSCR